MTRRRNLRPRALRPLLMCLGLAGVLVLGACSSETGAESGSTAPAGTALSASSSAAGDGVGAGGVVLGEPTGPGSTDDASSTSPADDASAGPASPPASTSAEADTTSTDTSAEVSVPDASSSESTTAPAPTTTSPAKTTTTTTTTAKTQPTETGPTTEESSQSSGSDGVSCPNCGDPGFAFTDTTVLDAADFPGTVTAVGFSSPSGNIRCSFADDGLSAGCQIEQRTYDVPASLDCHGAGSPGGAVTIDASGADFVCAGDLFTGGPVLEYGRSIAVGDYGCASRETGIQCINLTTGHAFIISKAFYQFA